MTGKVLIWQVRGFVKDVVCFAESCEQGGYFLTVEYGKETDAVGASSLHRRRDKAVGRATGDHEDDGLAGSRFPSRAATSPDSKTPMADTLGGMTEVGGRCRNDPALSASRGTDSAGPNQPSYRLRTVSLREQASAGPSGSRARLGS